MTEPIADMFHLDADTWIGWHQIEPERADGLVEWIEAHIPPNLWIISAALGEGFVDVEVVPKPAEAVRFDDNDQLVTTTIRIPCAAPPPDWPTPDEIRKATR